MTDNNLVYYCCDIEDIGNRGVLEMEVYSVFIECKNNERSEDFYFLREEGVEEVTNHFRIQAPCYHFFFFTYHFCFTSSLFSLFFLFGFLLRSTWSLSLPFFIITRWSLCCFVRLLLAGLSIFNLYMWF